MWRDQDGIARTDESGRPVDLHVTGAFQQEIDLLAPFVVVPLSRASHRQAGFSEALILHRSVRQVQNTANLRAILGDERFLTG